MDTDGQDVDAPDFEGYVARQRQALLRFAVVLTGDSVLADDIVSDVLSTAYERWRTVGAADNVHAYVRRMVVNEFLSWRRRRARTTVRADLEPVIAPEADHAVQHAEHVALVGELAKLPSKQRAALVLRYYEGLSYAEIAAVLRSGENAVRSNVSRALAQLRIHLTESDERGDTDRPSPRPAAEAQS